MNMLEVFNKVEAHLLAQGEKSMSYNGLSDVCAYRGEGGMQCAVGCLIKDEFYSKGLEGWSISPVKRGRSIDKALINSGIDLSPEMAHMLNDLQYLHDTNDPEIWEQGLQKLRVRYFGIDTSKTCDEKTAIDRHNNQWVGLTHEEVNSWELPDLPTVFEFAQFIEAKLKEKNDNQWVGLTHEEKHYLNDVLNLQGRFPIIDAIESKLKHKNSERQKGGGDK